MALNPCKVYMAGHSLGAHIGGFACKYVKENGGLVQEMAGKFFFFISIDEKAFTINQKNISLNIILAYDTAGPLLQSNNCFWQLGMCECGMDKDVANRTISMSTNPGELGSANENLGQINIQCNPPNYEQPGLTISDPFHNHNYAGFMCAAISSGAKCIDNSYPYMNLNYIDNENIPYGTFQLQTSQCFPFHC